jgi:hypothetical protein
MTDSIQAIRHWIDRVLYGTITTTAVLFGIQVQETGLKEPAVMALVWATGLGLLVAHGVAGALAHRLTRAGRTRFGAYTSLFREELPLLLPSAAATLGLTIGSLLSDDITWWIRSADLAMAALAGGIAFYVGTRAGITLWRRLAYSTIIVAIVLGAAVTKLLLGH